MNEDRARCPPLDFRWHILIAVLLAGLIAGCYQFVDRPAVVWARGLDPQVVGVFKNITILGSSTPYLIALAALYPALRFYLRRAAAAQRALFVLAAIVISGLTVDLLKPVVARWRPKAFFADPSQYGFAFFKVGYEHNSFPSGHATTAWAVACALTLLYPRLRVLWIGAAAVVASSRVIVGAHYPGDVLAGAWFGIVISLVLGRTAWFRDVLEAPGWRCSGACGDGSCCPGPWTGRRGGAEGRSPAGERSEADGGPQRQDPAARPGTTVP